MTLKNYPDEDLANLSIEVLVYSKRTAAIVGEYAEGIVQPDRLEGKTELEPIVDSDLNAFSEFYMKALSNTGLSSYERAAIKTYLHWKLLPPVR